MKYVFLFQCIKINVLLNMDFEQFLSDTETLLSPITILLADI